MANRSDSTIQFFKKATPDQWSYMLNCYKDAVYAKAQLRLKKGGPEQFIKLDNWFQEQLPKIIRSRKDPHLEYGELVDLMKWKLFRTKYKPASLDLVKTNTEKNVKNTTQRAFKRMPNISVALQALTVGLKGIGTVTASAILAAAYPEYAPYMAEECMVSTPEVDAEDFTQAEYFKYADHYQRFAAKLAEKDQKAGWNPHKVELAIWSHYILRLHNPALIDAMPGQLENGAATEEDSNQGPLDGPQITARNGVNTASSCDEDSQQTNGTLAEDNSNSLPTNGTTGSNGTRSPQKQNGNTLGLTNHHPPHTHAAPNTECTTDNDTRSSLAEESSQASADCEASSDSQGQQEPPPPPIAVAKRPAEDTNDVEEESQECKKPKVDHVEPAPEVTEETPQKVEEETK